jgi:hypothetical protein
LSAFVAETFTGADVFEVAWWDRVLDLDFGALGGFGRCH